MRMWNKNFGDTVHIPLLHASECIVASWMSHTRRWNIRYLNNETGISTKLHKHHLSSSSFMADGKLPRRGANFCLSKHTLSLQARWSACRCAVATVGLRWSACRCAVATVGLRWSACRCAVATVGLRWSACRCAVATVGLRSSELNPSSCPAAQGSLTILCSQLPPLVSILSQIGPVHTNHDPS
jgi:hypothetical protein